MDDSVAKSLRNWVPYFTERPNESITTTLTVFEALSIYDGWSPEIKCQKIIGILGGRARRKFLDLPQEDRAYWTTLKARWIEIFSPRGWMHIIQSAFFNAVPAPGEPAASYIFWLTAMAEQCFPQFSDADRDDIVKGQFRHTMKEPLRTYLFREYRTKGLADIELAATNYELGAKMAKGLGPIVQNRDIGYRIDSWDTPSKMHTIKDLKEGWEPRRCLTHEGPEELRFRHIEETLFEVIGPAPRCNFVVQ